MSTQQLYASRIFPVIHRKILCILLFFATFSTVAQDTYCYTMGSECLYNQSETVKFIPDQYSPEITINLNFHFYQQDGGNGNGDIFNPMNFAETWDGITVGQMADGTNDGIDNPVIVTGSSFADAIIWRINNRLEYNPQMNLPIGNSTPNLPFGFKFRKNEVFYHAWTPGQSLPNFSEYVSDDAIDIFFFDNDADVVTNPVSFGLACGTITVPDFPTGWDFTNDGIENPGSYGQHGFSNYGWNYAVIRESWVLFKHYADDWCDYQSAYENHIWSCSRQILHEVGHAFCLPHTVLYGGGALCYNCEDYCDDTPTAQEMLVANGVHPGLCNAACAEEPSVCSNNLMDYCEASVALTPKQLGRWYYSLYTDHLHTVYNDYCLHDGSTTTLNGGTTATWEGIRICKGDIIVEGGATLTLKGRLWMPEHGKIIVKPGGKLYINGGCIGTLCDGLWEGIEVWGNSSLSQTTTNQGLVELTNNALLEEARTAIRTIKNTGPTHYSNLDWSKTGGIIRATNANFKNNWHAIEFMSYHNKNSQNVQINNVSYFYNCLFETNEISHFEEQSNTVFISMWDVIGIRIYGSTFDYPVPAETVEDRGNGIVAAMSTFQIKDYGADRNLFQNLNRAINASGPMKGFYPSIDHAQFLNNRGGILLTGFASSRITRNDFNWQEITDPGNVPTYGVYLQECQGYTVEENYFDAAGGIETFGVAVNNSGDHITRIYKNYFTNLNAASMVYNDNRDEAHNNVGLQWLCNDYGTSDGNNSNTYQIGLWGEEVFGIPSSQSFFQGTNPNVSAGNKFFDDCTPDPNDLNEYPNERELKLMEQVEDSYYEYVHDASDVSKPDCRTPGIGLIFTNANNTNNCPTNLDGITHNPSGLVAGIQAAHAIEQQLKTSYDGYANNGTGPLLRNIISDASKTSIEVRNALMDAAPSVTDDLLIMTLNRQPALLGWHMAQAMLANSPLRAAVLAELAQTDYYPYYKSLVYAGQTGGLTARQIMEMDYANYRTEQYLGLDELLQLQFNLEEEGDENWVEVEQDLSTLAYLLSEKDKALILAAKGDLLSAKNELLNCTSDEADYCDVISAVFEMQINGMTNQGLSTRTVNELQNVATDAGHKMKGTASQLLAFWNIGGFEEFLELPVGAGLRAAKVPALENLEIKNIAVNPNPASDNFYINYLLPDGCEEAVIHVYDHAGKMIAIFNTIQFNGVIEMSGKNLSPGIYTIDLVANNIKIDTAKLTVIQ